MNDFLSTMKENFSKLPPWGWGLLVGGFALVVYLSSKKSGGSTYTDSPDYAPGVLETNKVSEEEVAQKIGNIVQDLNKSFDERFEEQNKAFDEQAKAYEEQMAEYTKGFEERISALTNTSNRPSSGSNTSYPTVSQPDAGKTQGVFQSGSFTTKEDAQRLASSLSKTYGGSNVEVVNVNGQWSARGNFSDTDRANAVGNDLKNNGKLGHYNTG